MSFDWCECSADPDPDSDPGNLSFDLLHMLSLLLQTEAATFQIHKYKYKIQNTQIQKYTNTKYKIHKYTHTQIQNIATGETSPVITSLTLMTFITK